MDVLGIPGGGYHHIPHRRLVRQGLTNLLLGSRCISGAHEAHCSHRVMALISAMGKAAGTAAALAVRQNGMVRNVDIPQIRQSLRDRGRFIEAAEGCRTKQQPHSRANQPPSIKNQVPFFLTAGYANGAHAKAA